MASIVQHMRSVLTAVDIALRSSAAAPGTVCASRADLLGAMSNAFASQANSSSEPQAMPILLTLLQALQTLLVALQSPGASAQANTDMAVRFSCLQLLISLMRIYGHPDGLGAPCAMTFPLQMDPTGMQAPSGTYACAILTPCHGCDTSKLC